MIRLASSVALALLLGSVQAFAQSASDEIEAANAKFEDAFNAGKGAGLAGLYTEDAAILPPGAQRVDGRDAIAAFWQKAIDAGLTDLDLRTTEVLDAGDHAFEVGTVSLTAPGADGKAQEVVGKYIVVWQRGDDGLWRLHRDIWNTDPPSQ